jgi:hypothetical protein
VYIFYKFVKNRSFQICTCQICTHVEKDSLSRVAISNPVRMVYFIQEISNKLIKNCKKIDWSSWRGLPDFSRYNIPKCKTMY